MNNKDKWDLKDNLSTIYSKVRLFFSIIFRWGKEKWEARKFKTFAFRRLLYGLHF